MCSGGDFLKVAFLIALLRNLADCVILELGSLADWRGADLLLGPALAKGGARGLALGGDGGVDGLARLESLLLLSGVGGGLHLNTM